MVMSVAVVAIVVVLVVVTIVQEQLTLAEDLLWARHCSKLFTHIAHLIFTNVSVETITIIFPILQKRKLKHRKLRCPAQGHTAGS